MPLDTAVAASGGCWQTLITVVTESVSMRLSSLCGALLAVNGMVYFLSFKIPYCPVLLSVCLFQAHSFF